MKNSILSISAAALLALTLIGCGGAEAKPAEPSFACKQDNQLAPKWTCNPFVEGSYSDLGVAAKSPAGMGTMRRQALSQGRSNLAQQINTKIKDKVKSFVQTTGEGESATVDKLFAAATTQVAKVSLSGSKSVDMWQSDKGTIYMLVAVPEAVVNAPVKEAIKTSMKSDDARWQQFQAKKALDDLEAEFPTN